MTRETFSEPAEPSLPLRLAAAASIAGHLAVLGMAVFAGVRPYGANPDAIAVELVTPADLPVPDTKPSESKPPPELPQLTATEQPQPQAAAPSASPPPPKQTAAASPSQQAAPQQDASQQPAPQQAAASSAVPPSPWSAEAPRQPDITDRYHVMLGLPADDIAPAKADMGGGEAAAGADVARRDADKLRAHLRTCSILPGGVSRSDKVRIVMRVALTQDGRLASPPALIEASASTKGPALMQAAIKALQDCQPYAMLPAEKYREWRVLDLGFTPADFNG